MSNATVTDANRKRAKEYLAYTRYMENTRDVITLSGIFADIEHEAAISSREAALRLEAVLDTIDPDDSENARPVYSVTGLKELVKKKLEQSFAAGQAAENMATLEAVEKLKLEIRSLKAEIATLQREVLNQSEISDIVITSKKFAEENKELKKKYDDFLQGAIESENRRMKTFDRCTSAWSSFHGT